jgi:phosphosulfolactate synthase (CoM biosynthesis protein A)
MVLDKFMGLHGTADLIETAGEYVDVVKLGWGSCVLYPEAVLVKKVGMLRDAGVHVCPGGTFLETAFEHGKVEVILDLAKEIGFDAIEISNGIHPDMTRGDKLQMIRLATERGFHTMSEVGKKLPQEDGAMTYQQRIQEVREDLAAGARKVIMEARETGTVGIFKADGKINFFEGQGAAATLLAQSEMAYGSSCPGTLLPFVSLLEDDVFCEVLQDCSAPPILDSGSGDKSCKLLNVRSSSVLAGPHGFPARNALSRAVLDWEMALDPLCWPAGMDSLLVQYASERAAVKGKKLAQLTPSDLFDDECKLELITP